MVSKASRPVEVAVGKDPNRLVKVAVVQYEPEWFDVEAATKKTCELIAEAGKNRAELIAFPELWIPGYPNFLWAHGCKTNAEYMRVYYRNSVEVDSSHMHSIRAAARAAKIMVVIGISERDKGSLYMSQTFIGPDGNILIHRRKFKPTGFERVLFGDASGDCTMNVVATPLGRVGGLQCFEHLQPLLKYNTYFQGEQIHVASWPCLFKVNGDMPFFNSVEACRMATHTYAIEGGAFVLLASQVQTAKGLRANGLTLDTPEGEDPPHTAMEGGGFSVIIGPDGRALTEPVPDTWEGIIYHDLDFNEIYIAKSFVDPVGHYSRPDLFSLKVNSNINRHCVVEEVDGPYTHVSRFPDLEDE